jgi:hypothetical protein
MSTNSEDATRWVQQWEGASRALAEQRRLELRALSEAQAATIADSLLSMPDLPPLSEERLHWSGLVEFHQWLAPRPPRESAI